MHIRIEPSTRPGKKLLEIVYKAKDGGESRFKTVHFGEKGAGGYTKRRDDVRKKSYLARHGATEDWGKSGMFTPGFLAKNILWNKPTLTESIEDLNKRYKGANFLATRRLFVKPLPLLPSPS